MFGKHLGVKKTTKTIKKLVTPKQSLEFPKVVECRREPSESLQMIEEVALVTDT